MFSFVFTKVIIHWSGCHVCMSCRDRFQNWRDWNKEQNWMQSNAQGKFSFERYLIRWPIRWLKTLKQIMAISSPDDVRYVSMDTPFLHSNEIFNKQKTIAVAIDPIQKFIYFLTYLSKGDECRSCLPIIARVNLDGSGYKTIISSGIGHSEGLALDYHNQVGFKLIPIIVLWLASALVQW